MKTVTTKTQKFVQAIGSALVMLSTTALVMGTAAESSSADKGSTTKAGNSDGETALFIVAICFGLILLGLVRMVANSGKGALRSKALQYFVHGGISGGSISHNGRTYNIYWNSAEIVSYEDIPSISVHIDRGDVEECVLIF